MAKRGLETDAVAAVGDGNFDVPMLPDGDLRAVADAVLTTGAGT